MSIKAVLKTTTPCEVVIEVEVSQDALTAAYEKTFKQNNRYIEMPGFRAGKAPRVMVEKQYKPQIQAHTIEDLAGTIIRQVVAKHKLEPITSPKMVEEPQYPETGSLKFNVEFEVAPAVELVDYSGIKLTKKKSKITKKQIDDIVKQATERYATYEEVTEDRGAVFGDWIVANYVATSGGTEVLKRDSAWIDVNIETNQPAPGFGSAVQGIKKGETRKFTITAPDNFFKKDFVGKEIDFTVNALDIRERVLPVLDDELVKKLDPSLSTPEELRAAIKDNQLVYLDDQEKFRLKDLAREQLVKLHEVPLPPTIVNSRVRRLVEEKAREMMQKGQSQEEVGKKIEALTKECTSQAEIQLKSEYILDAIATKEDIKVDEADIQPQLKYYAEAFKKDIAWVKQMFEREGKIDALYLSARENKALDLVYDQIQITEK